MNLDLNAYTYTDSNLNLDMTDCSYFKFGQSFVIIPDFFLAL